MKRLIFEWDENKRQSNLRKHSIDFIDAAKIFNSLILERVDDRYDYGETRIIALGEVNGIVLFVIYTLRNEARRIISARKASKSERRKYYQTIHR